MKKQRWEESEKRREEARRSEKRRVRRKKMQVCEKVDKLWNTVFFQWFVAPEGWKVGSLKRRVRSHLARREMNNCTPLWREAHFEVKSVKNWRSRSNYFWKLRCRTSASCCGAKHISKSKCTKHTILQALLEVEMSKKWTPLWRSTFRSQKCSKHLKTDGVGAPLEVVMLKKRTLLCSKTDCLRPLLDVQMLFCVAGARDCAPCQKWAKREGFVACPKAMAGMGHLKRICQNAFCVAGAVQETCSPEMLGCQNPDFLRGFAFWSIRSSGLLRWICETGAALRMAWHHFFVAGAML